MNRYREMVSLLDARVRVIDYRFLHDNGQGSVGSRWCPISVDVSRKQKSLSVCGETYVIISCSGDLGI